MNRHLYWPHRARIQAIEEECAGVRPVRTYSLAWAEDPPPRFDFVPGQCAQLGVMGAGEIFVAIASAPEAAASLQFSIMKVGHVTTALHALGVGDHVSVRGPFGNGFPVEDWHGLDLVLIGGGLGQAPLRSLLHHVLARRQDFGRIQLFHGARSTDAMIYLEELTRYEGGADPEVYLSIDWKGGADGLRDEDAEEGWSRVSLPDPAATRVAPGQCRFTGFVPQVVEAVAPSPARAVAVTCGPPVMIDRVLQSLLRLGFKHDRIFTTLERRMKCGVGLCGRCNLGPVFVCTEGPVFSCQELLRQPEAFA